MAKEYANKGLVIVAPSLDAEATVKKFKKDFGIEYPLLADARPTAKAYGVRAYPTMFLVGADGKVKWKGHFKNASLLKAIDKALAEGKK